MELSPRRRPGAVSARKWNRISDESPRGRTIVPERTAPGVQQRRGTGPWGPGPRVLKAGSGEAKVRRSEQWGQIPEDAGGSQEHCRV